MRVLGIDPGLTRCGLGVVDGLPGRQPQLIAVDVVRTPPELDIARRLMLIEETVDLWITDYRRPPWPWSGCSPSTTCRP